MAEPPDPADLFNRLRNQGITDRTRGSYRTAAEIIAMQASGRRPPTDPYNTTAEEGYIPPGTQNTNYTTDSVFFETADIAVIDVESPTATKDPGRPRTASAAYNRDQKKMTIIFPDGTHYNYYDVPEGVWLTFKGLSTKGKWIKEKLDLLYDRGRASTSPDVEDTMSEMVQQARARQLRAARQAGLNVKMRGATSKRGRPKGSGAKKKKSY